MHGGGLERRSLNLLLDDRNGFDRNALGRLTFLGSIGARWATAAAEKDRCRQADGTANGPPRSSKHDVISLSLQVDFQRNRYRPKTLTIASTVTKLSNRMMNSIRNGSGGLGGSAVIPSIIIAEAQKVGRSCPHRWIS
jgi:hypothetical protein